MKTTRILIIEDEALFRELLRRTLSAEPGLTVVGEAEDGRTAIRLVDELKPDVILIDIELSGELDGVDVAEQVKKQSPKIAVVFLSSHSEHQYVSRLPLQEGGGWAYLLKQTVSSVDILMHAIEKAQAGLIVLDPQVANRLKARTTSEIARLSPSRMGVLRLMAQGYNNAAIARQQNLSVKSVENYINDIYEELGLKDLAELHARVKATLLYLRGS